VDWTNKHLELQVLYDRFLLVYNYNNWWGNINQDPQLGFFFLKPLWLLVSIESHGFDGTVIQFYLKSRFISSGSIPVLTPRTMVYPMCVYIYNINVCIYIYRILYELNNIYIYYIYYKYYLKNVYIYIILYILPYIQ
jgi:hypothetical protein